jgi:hypothetical protein
MGDSTASAGASSRRSFLRAGTAGALGVSVGLTGCLGILGGPSLTMAQRRKGTGSPVSFASQRKRIRKQDATVVVHNRSELVDALQTPGAVIWLPESVTIDMQPPGNISIEPNVTIASNRNLASGPRNGRGNGGKIKTDEYMQRIFLAKGPCRVTGVRLQGPEMRYFDPPYDALYSYAASCLQFQGQTAIVDNCEAYGWTAMALGIGTKGTPTQGWIHHNNFHHNQMNYLGYPMELFNGVHLIEWNYFAKYRHAITAYGYLTNGYEARCNIIGPPGGSPYAFAFDMHSLGEQSNFPSSNTTAGKYVNVHHNVFELTERNALSVSGIPTQAARFCDNWCATSKGGDRPGVPAVSIPDAATLRKTQNQFGGKAVPQGRQRLQRLAVKLPISNGKPSLGVWSLPTEAETSGKTQSSTTQSGTNGPQTAPSTAANRSTTEGNEMRRFSQRSAWVVVCLVVLVCAGVGGSITVSADAHSQSASPQKVILRTGGDSGTTYSLTVSGTIVSGPREQNDRTTAQRVEGHVSETDAADAIIYTGQITSFQADSSNLKATLDGTLINPQILDASHLQLTTRSTEKTSQQPVRYTVTVSNTIVSGEDTEARDSPTNTTTVSGWLLPGDSDGFYFREAIISSSVNRKASVQVNGQSRSLRSPSRPAAARNTITTQSSPPPTAQPSPSKNTTAHILVITQVNGSVGYTVTVSGQITLQYTEASDATPKEVPSNASVVTKTINGYDYYYWQWRDGETVTSTYKAPVNPKR